MENRLNVISTGFLCIDIINYLNDNIVIPGGTAANVCSFLSVLGLNAYLFVAEHSDPGWKWLSNSFVKRKINVYPFTKKKSVTSRVIETLDTNGKHSFLITCPKCGKKLLNPNLPTEKQITDNVLSLLKTTNLLFYDRMSPGIRKMVKNNTHGWNMYEPNSCRIYNTFLSASQETHLLKFSHDRIPNKYIEKLRYDLADSNVQIIIVSMGKQGLRVAVKELNQFSNWISIDSQIISDGIDSSGAGDWLTSAFLYNFLQKYPLFTQSINKEIVKDCLDTASIVAAEQCKYIGAQGILSNKIGTEKINKVLGSNIAVIEDPPLSSSECDVCYL